MLKKIGLPVLALFALLILVPVPQAQARVHIGIGIGVPAYPVYPAYPAYSYTAPYGYGYPGYSYPYAAPYYPYAYGYNGRRYYGGFRGHAHRDGRGFARRDEHREGHRGGRGRR